MLSKLGSFWAYMSLSHTLNPKFCYGSHFLLITITNGPLGFSFQLMCIGLNLARVRGLVLDGGHIRSDHLLASLGMCTLTRESGAVNFSGHFYRPSALSSNVRSVGRKALEHSSQIRKLISLVEGAGDMYGEYLCVGRISKSSPCFPA